jgi:hypothetical protein
MIKKLLLSIIFISLLCVMLINPALAQGPGQISVTNTSANMDFPLTLNFSAQIKSNTNITDLRVRYKIEQMTFADVITEASVPINPSPSIKAAWSLDMRKIGGLPPGSIIDYWWLVKDAQGSLLETEPSKFQVTDERYEWQNLIQDKISLFWYSGNDSFAQALMKTAQDSLLKLSKDTGVSPTKTINIYIYANSNDLQGSMIYPQEWTGGVAFTSYNIIAIGISPSQLEWGQGAMIHELAHNVIYQVVFNPYNDLPVWLNEGLAMYSEGALDPQYTGPLSNAVSNSTLLSVRTICSPFSAYTEKSLLSYAESFSLVDYLIYNYGSDKMSELLNTFKQGSTFDSAFLKVYGFDIDELNALWKPWVTSQYKK